MSDDNNQKRHLTSGSSSLIPFHYMPPGTPLNTQNVYLPATAPTHWTG